MNKKEIQDEPETVHEESLKESFAEIQEIQNETQPEFSWCVFSKKLLFVLVFLLPIFFLPLTLYPISFNQQTLVLVLASVILAGTILYLIAKGEVSIPKIFTSSSVIKLPIWYLLLTFVAVSVISLLLSKSFNYSLWGINGSEYDTIISLAAGVILFLSAGIILKTSDDFKNFVNVIIFSSLAALVFFIFSDIFARIFKKPLLGLLVNGFNTVGTIGVLSAFLGLGFIAMLIFLKLGLVQNKKTRKLLSLTLFIIFILIAAVSHRPTLNALVVSLILFLALYLYKNESIQISKLNIATFFIVVFLILSFIRLPLPKLFNFPVEISLSHNSSLKIALTSLAESLKNLFFGSGPNTYTFQYLKYKPSDINSSMFWNFDFTGGSSFWLTILVSLGLIGTLALFLFFLSIFIKALRSSNGAESEEDKSVSILLISMFFYLFALSFFMSFNFILLIMLFVVAAILMSHSSFINKDYLVPQFSKATIKNILISFVFIIVLVGSIVLMIFSVKRGVAYIIFGKAIYSYNTTKNIDEAIPRIALAARLHLNEDFARNLAALWFEKLKNAVSSVPNADADALKVNTQKSFDSAVGAMQIAINLNPLNYIYWVDLGGIYERIIIIAPNSDELASQTYLAAQRLNPRNPLMFINLARIEIIRGDNGLRNREQSYKNAAKYLQQAVQLKGNYTDAKYYLGLTYDKLNETSKAIKEFEDVLKLSPGNQDVIRILNNLKDGKRAF